MSREKKNAIGKNFLDNQNCTVSMSRVNEKKKRGEGGVRIVINANVSHKLPAITKIRDNKYKSQSNRGCRGGLRALDKHRNNNGRVVVVVVISSRDAKQPFKYSQEYTRQYSALVLITQ